MADASQAWDAQHLMTAARSRSPEAMEGARALQQLIQKSRGHDVAEKLALANDFFNRRISFQEDRVVWGTEDYWASPLELLERGRGDCEDYSIAKYFTLIAMGIPASKLRMVYVQARLDGTIQAHLVVAYYDQPTVEAPQILDNLVSEIKPANRRADLSPVFSFNGEGLWQGVGARLAGDPVARLSRWRDVLAKARTEGL